MIASTNTAPQPVQIGTVTRKGFAVKVWRTEIKPTRYNGRCGRCKRHISALVTAHVGVGWNYYAEGDIAAHSLLNGVVVVACCGRDRELHAVRSTYNPRIPCNARCTGAHGHDCECSCNGKNHGRDHG